VETMKRAAEAVSRQGATRILLLLLLLLLLAVFRSLVMQWHVV